MEERIMTSESSKNEAIKGLTAWQEFVYKDQKLNNLECVQFEHESDAAIDGLIKKLEAIHAKKTKEEKLSQPALVEKPRGLKHFKNACQLSSDLLQEALLSIKRSVPASQFDGQLKAEIKEAIMFQILYLKVSLDRFD